MRQKIGLISDTHGYLDDRILKHLEDCDQIWHAGDIGSYSVIEGLKKLQIPIKAVYGNIDVIDIQHEFPENQLFEIDGVKVLITHIGGRPDKYPARVKTLLALHKPHIYVCGHSHIASIQHDLKWNKMIFMNPGAAGNEGFHQIRTMMKFEIDPIKIIDKVLLIELGKRGRI